MSINLVQWEGSTVTPKLDAIMYDDGSYGIIKGCAITHQGTNLLKIANGFIKIAGRLIEIAEETIQCQVSASGTVNGQLWIRLDLSSVTPAVFMTEAAAVLTPLTQNADCNFQNGIYELQLATYNIDESVITNLVETAPELERLRTALENIDLDASNVTYHSTTVEAELDEINDNLAQTPITVGGITMDTINEKLNYLIEGRDFSNVGVGGVNLSNAISVTQGHQYIIACSILSQSATAETMTLSGGNVIKETAVQVTNLSSNRCSHCKLFVANATSSTITITASAITSVNTCVTYFDLGVVENN